MTSTKGFLIHTKTMLMMTLMALCNKVNNYASTYYVVWQLVNKLTSRWWQWMMMMVIMLVVMVAKFLPFSFLPWCKAWRSQGNLTVDWAKYKGGQRGSYQSLCQQHHHHHYWQLSKYIRAKKTIKTEYNMN